MMKRIVKQEAFKSTHEPFESNRWAMIITLLSMDVVIAFDDLMGLVLPDRPAFLAALRSLILEMRRQYAAGGPFYSPRLVSDTLESRLGAEVCAHVAWWGNRIFEKSTHDHPELDAWTITLRHCRDDAARWEQLGIPHYVSGEALQEFLRSIDTTEYDRRSDQVNARPLSDWDLHMYAINGFDDENELCPSGPGSYLYPTVMTYRGYRFWAWMLERLDAEQQATLAQRATLIARSTESLMFLGELPAPSCLDVGP